MPPIDIGFNTDILWTSHS